MPSRLEYELRLPDDFDEALWTSKGFCPDVELLFENKAYRLMFYDPVRLGQDSADEVENGSFFFEKNLVVVKRVDLENLKAAAHWLVETGQVKGLVE